MPQYSSAKQHLIHTWHNEPFITNKALMKAFLLTPREQFVLPLFKDAAYDDTPLPILAGQTISQPSTVMRMLYALNVSPRMNVLEVGTGSGYNAALLAMLVGPQGKVTSVEIIKELADLAQSNLLIAGTNNVNVINTDGSKGYAENAPYDRIIVTAGAPTIPDKLLEQLKTGGMVLIPVDTVAGGQKMLRITKTAAGATTEELGDYMFVPLTGEFGHRT